MVASVPGSTSLALETVVLNVAGSDRSLRRDLRAASLVISAWDEKRGEATDLLGAALADYRNLVETLYANGHYSGVVQILIDGREAASIPLLDAPRQINTIEIKVDPGPEFRFAEVNVTPAPPGLDPIKTTAPGAIASSEALRETVKANIDGWRDAGHAKADVVGQDVAADHTARTLTAQVDIAPGPRLRFGRLNIDTPSRVRADRIARIAGFPEGKVFSPEDLRKVANRLRRTGAFTSVSLQESDAIGADGTLDVTLSVVDEAPRRFGLGAELASFEGIRLSTFWLHRNAFGGAERFRFEVEVENIGGQTNGIDYSVGSRLEIPALFGPDTLGFVVAEYEHLEENTFTSDRFSFGFGLGKIFSDTFEAEIGLTYSYSDTTTTGLGSRTFSMLNVPATATWDRRDDKLDAKSGTYLSADVTPFFGLDGSASGVQTMLDGRAYRAVGSEERFVFAARVQAGSVIGPSLAETQPDFLFFSGGGGTVRGQPFQSLDIDSGGGVMTGGRSFLGLSAELRAAVTDAFGAVVFADAGYVGPESIFDGSGEWHSGVGVGLRYKTGLGPIRLDAAIPVGGNTGDGMQLYLGIGQSF